MGLMEMKTEQKRERRDKSKQCDQRKGSQQLVGDSKFNNFASQTMKTEGIRSAGPNALIHLSNPAHKTEGGITSHCCPQVLLPTLGCVYIPLFQSTWISLRVNNEQHLKSSSYSAVTDTPQCSKKTYRHYHRFQNNDSCCTMTTNHGCCRERLLIHLILLSGDRNAGAGLIPEHLLFGASSTKAGRRQIFTATEHAASIKKICQ